MENPSHDSAFPQELEHVIEGFEAVWSRGNQPVIEEFVPDGHPRRIAILRELVHVDLEWRRKRGDDVEVQEYLLRFPELAEDEGAADSLRDAALAQSRYGTQLPATSRNSRDSSPEPDDPNATLLGPSGPGTSGGKRFQVLRAHARGGLGQIWIALDHELNRKVALKEIQQRFADDDYSRARFTFEAEVTGKLEHPGIVPIYSLGSDDEGRPFYAMRFIQGRNLTESVRQFHQRKDTSDATSRRNEESVRQVQFRQLLHRFIAVCRAVDYAHHQGILHRDLKPDNIMLGDFGETLVVDWGLSKYVGTSTEQDVGLFGGHMPQSGSQQTLPGSVVGTPQYMSPEQAAGRLDKISPASDVYSLGATLYFLLTGRVPFQGENLQQILNRVARGDFPPPRAMAVSTPKALEAVCLKAMKLAPEDRYVSCGALADDVEHWLADEPVVAWREPFWHFAVRWFRRHRAWTVSGAAALLLIAVASIIALLVVNDARDKVVLAYRQEQAAKEQAVEQHHLAQDAMDTWLTGVSEILKLYPGVQQARIRLLQKAADDYHRLANASAADPALQLESARTWLRLGDAHQRLDNPSAALTAYRSAESKLLNLSGSELNSPTVPLEVAGAHTRLGAALMSQGEVDQARAMFQTALKEFDELRQRFPDDASILAAKAGAGVHYAELLVAQGDEEQATNLLQETVNTLRKVVSVRRDDVRILKGYTAACSALGRVFLRNATYDQALPLFQTSLITWGALAQLEPDNPDHLLQCAAAQIDLAAIYRSRLQEKEEIACYKAALSDYATVLKALPDLPSVRESQALTLINLGQVLQQTAYSADARDVLLAAADILAELAEKQPDAIRLRIAYAACHSTLGLAQRDLGDRDAAQQALSGAVAIYEHLRTEFPADRDAQERWAIASTHRASLRSTSEEFELAVEELDAAASALDKLLSTSPHDAYDLEARAWNRLCLADIRASQERTADFRDCIAEAVRSLTPGKEHARLLLRLSVLLSNYSSPDVRDPSRALQSAERLTQLAPQSVSAWTALVAARYRTGDHERACQAAAQAQRHKIGTGGAYDLWQAMAEQALGHQDNARQCLARGREFVQQNCSANRDLLNLLREADSLIN